MSIWDRLFRREQARVNEMRAAARASGGRGIVVPRGGLFVVRAPSFSHRTRIMRPRRGDSAKLRRDYLVAQRMGERVLARFIEDNYEVVAERTARNVVTTVGVTALIDSFFKGTTPPANWYVGVIKGAGAPTLDVADTMASHAGWTEIAGTDVTEANRQAFTGGTVVAGSIDNSASKARYTGNANFTAQGLFVVTNNTIGGTTGTLYSEAAYAEGSAAMQSGYLLDNQATISVTAA